MHSLHLSQVYKIKDVMFQLALLTCFMHVKLMIAVANSIWGVCIHFHSGDQPPLSTYVRADVAFGDTMRVRDCESIKHRELDLLGHWDGLKTPCT